MPDGNEPASGPVVRNAARFMAGDVVDRLLGFAFLAAALRLYGVADYGTYVVGLTVFQLVRTLVGFGLGRSIMKETAAGTAIGDPGRVKGAILLGMALSSVFSLIAAAVLVAGADRIAEFAFPSQTGVSTTLTVFGVLTPLYAVNFVLLQAFYGAGRIRDMVLANSFIEPAVRLAALLSFFLAGSSGAFALPAAYFVALGASTVFAGARFAGRVWPELSAARSQFDLRETLSFAFPVMLTDLFSRGLRSLNTFLFAAFRTAPEVGIFDIAIKLCGVAFFFTSSLVTAFRPRIAGLIAQERLDDLSRETQAYTRWIFSFAILPLGFLIVFPDLVLELASPDFVYAATGVRILACGVLVAQSGGPLAALLLMSGRSKQVLYAMVSAASVYTIASIQTIPTYGIDGAAAAATGTVLLAVPIAAVYVRRTVGVSTHGPAIWKPILAAIVAFAVAIAISTLIQAGPRFTVVVLAAVATCIYAGALLAFGVDPHDRELLGSIAGVLARKFRLPGARRAARKARGAQRAADDTSVE